MWMQKIPAGVVSLAFGPDGRVLYVLDTRGEITAWDTAARTPRSLYRLGTTPDIRLPDADLKVACDGRFLVVRLRSSVHVWDVTAGAEHARLAHEPTGYIPSLDPTGRLLIARDPLGNALTTWDIAERKPGPLWLQAERDAERFNVFTTAADGNTIALTLYAPRREIALYDRLAGRSFARIENRPTIGPVLRLAFSPDGKTLAILGLSGVTLWDVPSQTIRGYIQCPMPAQLFAIHPTLPIIAARNSSLHITLFRLDTGEAIRSFDFTMGTSSLNCVAFSPDGLTCAVGGSNKQFAVFDVDV